VHIRSKHDGVTFDCTMCSLKFKHKHTLQRHKRKHTEEPVEPAPRKKKRTVDVLLGGVHPKMYVEEITTTATKITVPPRTLATTTTTIPDTYTSAVRTFTDEDDFTVEISDSEEKSITLYGNDDIEVIFE